MNFGLSLPLWAVHLSDSILQPQWQWYGFGLAGLLMLLGGWRMREEDLPPTALLAAAFFVASLIHVKVGPTSAHLLFNGLLGILLGRRAALAIPAGLLLQALLLGHGGVLALGVNSCVLVLPALATRCLFVFLHRHRLATALIVASSLLAALGLVAAIALLVTHPPGSSSPLSPEPVLRVLSHPATVAGCLALGVMVAWSANRRPVAPEFALGMFLGELAVLLTLVLQGAFLLVSEASFSSLVAVMFVVHLPIAVIEGIVLGFTVAFLARVKPQMLGLRPLTIQEGTACAPAS